ncbi:RNA polymerase I enhancer binding protein [Gryganskiella cystojenkinii]|nr:RNA polymerase I enhancer binding protein [Gryganskiella cystojenkinii]
MSLSNPSVLATISDTTGTQIQPALSDLNSATTNKTSKKKSNGKEQKKPKGGRTPVVDHTPVVPVRTLQEQLDYDLAGGESIKYRTGTFSMNEDLLIRQTIREYLARNGMPADTIETWFQGSAGRNGVVKEAGKEELKPLWVEIARRLETRPLLNIYLHVRRMFHPQNNVGQWTKEDDNKLVELYTKHKGQWTAIGLELGRMADSCRDRYRNNLKDRDHMVTGSWRPYEDEWLLALMQVQAIKQKKSSILDSVPMWTALSEGMDGSRTRHQCRHRYAQTLQGRLQRGEWKGATTASEAAKVVEKARAEAVKYRARHSASNTQQEQGQASPSSSSHDTSSADASQQIIDTLTGLAVSNNNNGNSDMEDTAAFAAAITSAPEEEKVFRVSRVITMFQQLDVCQMIQNAEAKESIDVDWAPIVKQLLDIYTDVCEEVTKKIKKVKKNADALVDKYKDDGEIVRKAAEATRAAVRDVVESVKQDVTDSRLQVPNIFQCTKSFLQLRSEIDGYLSMPFQESVELLLENLKSRVPRIGDVPPHMKEDATKKEKRRAKSYRGDWSAYGIQQKRLMLEQAQQIALCALATTFPEATHRNPVRRLIKFAVYDKDLTDKKNDTKESDSKNGDSDSDNDSSSSSNSSSSSSSNSDDGDSDDKKAALISTQSLSRAELKKQARTKKEAKRKAKISKQARAFAREAYPLQTGVALTDEDTLKAVERTVEIARNAEIAWEDKDRYQLTRDLAELFLCEALIEVGMVSTLVSKTRFLPTDDPRRPAILNTGSHKIAALERKKLRSDPLANVKSAEFVEDSDYSSEEDDD